MVISPTLPMGPEDRANKAAHRRQCRLPGHPQRQHLRLGMGQHCLEEPQEGRQLNSEGGSRNESASRRARGMVLPTQGQSVVSQAEKNRPFSVSFVTSTNAEREPKGRPGKHRQHLDTVISVSPLFGVRCPGACLEEAVYATC